MNVITAAHETRQARTRLYADYTDDHVTEYCAAAIAYNDSTGTTLRLLSLLTALASVALAAYFFLTHSADLGTFAVAVLGVAAVLAINSYTSRRYSAAANMARINSTVTVAREIDIRVRQRRGH